MCTYARDFMENTKTNSANSATPPTQSSAETAVARRKRPEMLPKKRKLRIGEREITAMCQMLAQRMTERESCQVLGIAEATWYRWKSHARNSERLRKFLDRITGEKIRTHISNIEQGAIGAGPHKRADWRASKALLEIVDPSRYGQQQSQPPAVAPAVQPATIAKWLANAFPAQVSAPPAGAVVDTTETPIIDTWTPRLLAAKNEAPTPEPQPAGRKGAS